MTTPVPARTGGRRSPRRTTGPRPRLRLGYTAWLISWLGPTLAMGLALLGLSFIPAWETDYLVPLIPLIGAAAVVIGLPGTFAVSWLLRHQLNPMVHVLGYTLVGLLYGPVVLLEGGSGLMPMLIPIIGFPAGILLGIGRWAVQPMASLTSDAGSAQPPADQADSAES